jgi:hypothetical protein
MLVHRDLFIVKRGCMNEAVVLCAAEQREMDLPHAFRLYRPYIGSYDQLVCEGEWESLQEYEEFWAQWNATRGEAFLEKINPLVERHSRDLWQLVE